MANQWEAYVQAVKCLGIDAARAEEIAAYLEKHGEGRTHVQWIIEALRAGDITKAVWTQQQQADKDTPPLREYFRKVFGCLLHARRDCQHIFCKR